MLLWASSFIALKLAFRFYVNLIPVFTAILGWIVPGEQFTFIQYAACALVFMGVLLSRDRQSVWGLPGVQ